MGTKSGACLHGDIGLHQRVRENVCGILWKSEAATVCEGPPWGEENGFLRNGAHDGGYESEGRGIGGE